MSRKSTRRILNKGEIVDINWTTNVATVINDSPNSDLVSVMKHIKRKGESPVTFFFRNKLYPINNPDEKRAFRYFRARVLRGESRDYEISNLEALYRNYGIKLVDDGFGNTVAIDIGWPEIEGKRWDVDES